MLLLKQTILILFPSTACAHASSSSQQFILTPVVTKLFTINVLKGGFKVRHYRSWH
jgi:hypothetical protein